MEVIYNRGAGNNTFSTRTQFPRFELLAMGFHNPFPHIRDVATALITCVRPGRQTLWLRTQILESQMCSWGSSVPVPWAVFTVLEGTMHRTGGGE